MARENVSMDDAEVADFLRRGSIVNVATFGPRGYPHVMPLSYAVRESIDGGIELWTWTYPKSQKVRNLVRDPRASLLIERSDTYNEYRGVMLEVDVEIHDDLATVVATGRDVIAHGRKVNRRPGVNEVDVPLNDETLEREAAKRVALRFVERHRVSFDFGKTARARAGAES